MKERNLVKWYNSGKLISLQPYLQAGVSVKKLAGFFKAHQQASNRNHDLGYWAQLKASFSACKVKFLQMMLFLQHVQFRLASGQAEHLALEWALLLDRLAAGDRFLLRLSLVGLPGGKQVVSSDQDRAAFISQLDLVNPDQRQKALLIIRNSFINACELSVILPEAKSRMLDAELSYLVVQAQNSCAAKSLHEHPDLSRLKNMAIPTS